MKLYVYNTADNLHIATICGETNKSCEAKAEQEYDDDDTYGWTYSPAFGLDGGLICNDDAQDIEA